MNNAIKIIAPIGLLILGAAGAAGLIASGKTAERADPELIITPVEILTVAEGSNPALIQGTGVVKADQEITVMPQVAGQIVSISPALIPGGRLSAGEVIAQIDTRDYSLTVQQEQSRVAQAEVDAQLEAGRQNTAEREWALLGEGRDSSEVPLALRRPQAEASAQSLASARAGLQKAQINLSRTSLTAPFNAMVISESVDVGQVVGNATQVARLVGTDRFRVDVAVPFEQLRALDVPGINAEIGSPATVTWSLGGDDIVRDGRVVSLAGELDAQTRNAQLIVSIDEPLSTDVGGLPLMPGAFVDVTLHGRDITGSFSVPRSAVYQGDRVWIVDDEDRLAAVTISGRWGDADDLIITSGLQPGARVVVSPLSLPIEGAPVRASERK